jgi:hypothetical protein
MPPPSAKVEDREVKQLLYRVCSACIQSCSRDRRLMGWAEWGGAGGVQRISRHVRSVRAPNARTAAQNDLVAPKPKPWPFRRHFVLPWNWLIAIVQGVTTQGCMPAAPTVLHHRESAVESSIDRPTWSGWPICLWRGLLDRPLTREGSPKTVQYRGRVPRHDVRSGRPVGPWRQCF